MNSASKPSVLRDKKILRGRLRAYRAGLTPDFVCTASCAAQKRLLTSVQWRSLTDLPGFSVFCYLASVPEVQTDMILKECRKLGFPVCVPAYSPARRCYLPAWLAPDAPLRSGRLGILEPVDPQWLSSDDRVGLTVTPGLGFDRRGARLGHGGGHYDRMLALGCLSGSLKVGLAFEFQVVDKLPVSDWDIPVDFVVTAAGLYYSNGGGI